MVAACSDRPGGCLRLRGRGVAGVAPDMRAEYSPEFLMPALADEVQVDLAERRQVPERVVDQHLAGPGGCSGAGRRA